MYQELAEKTTVFNTQTSEGDPNILREFRRLALLKAMIVLRADPMNGPARRVAKWAVRSDFHDPDFSSLSAVSRLVLKRTI